MAIHRNHFDSYRLQYTASTRPLPAASISCYDGEDYVGLISFHGPGQELHEPRISLGRIYMHFPIERFADVLHIIQTEKPLELCFNDAGGWASILTQGMEPVGEQEGSGGSS